MSLGNVYNHWIDFYTTKNSELILSNKHIGVTIKPHWLGQHTPITGKFGVGTTAYAIIVLSMSWPLWTI